MEKISSLQNPKIKNLKRLEKSSERREQNLFLIEGLRETVLAHRAGYTIETLFVCEEILTQSKEYSLAEITRANESFSITKAVYDSLAYRETTEGVIATARPQSHTLEKLELKASPLILIIEGVEKPGNLGAMLRTCDAAGVDAVIVCDPKTDVYNPNVIRSAVGTVFTNRIAVCETNEAIAFLKKHNITSYAAELSATDMYFEKDLIASTAIIVGTEATGLSKEWVSAADERIKIPMLGKIDSLNVSVSAAVLLFEAVKQREKSRP